MNEILLFGLVCRQFSINIVEMSVDASVFSSKSFIIAPIEYTSDIILGFFSLEAISGAMNLFFDTSFCLFKRSRKSVSLIVNLSL